MRFLTSSRLIVSVLQWTVLLLPALAPLTVVHAQDLDNASISGQVFDQNAALISSATVEAALDKTGARRVTTTDGEGRFRALQLEPGVYNLRVSCTGFGTQQKQGITLVATQNLHLDIVLYPQG